MSVRFEANKWTSSSQTLEEDTVVPTGTIAGEGAVAAGSHEGTIVHTEDVV